MSAVRLLNPAPASGAFPPFFFWHVISSILFVCPSGYRRKGLLSTVPMLRSIDRPAKGKDPLHHSRCEVPGPKLASLTASRLQVVMNMIATANCIVEGLEDGGVVGDKLGGFLRWQSARSLLSGHALVKNCRDNLRASSYERPGVFKVEPARERLLVHKVPLLLHLSQSDPAAEPSMRRSKVVRTLPADGMDDPVHVSEGTEGGTSWSHHCDERSLRPQVVEHRLLFPQVVEIITCDEVEIRPRHQASSNSHYRRACCASAKLHHIHSGSHRESAFDQVKNAGEHTAGTVTRSVGDFCLGSKEEAECKRLCATAEIFFTRAVIVFKDHVGGESRKLRLRNPQTSEIRPTIIVMIFHRDRFPFHRDPLLLSLSLALLLELASLRRVSSVLLEVVLGFKVFVVVAVVLVGAVVGDGSLTEVGSWASRPSRRLGSRSRGVVVGGGSLTKVGSRASRPSHLRCYGWRWVVVVLTERTSLSEQR